MRNILLVITTAGTIATTSTTAIAAGMPMRLAHFLTAALSKGLRSFFSLALAICSSLSPLSAQLNSLSSKNILAPSNSNPNTPITIHMAKPAPTCAPASSSELPAADTTAPSVNKIKTIAPSNAQQK